MDLERQLLAGLEERVLHPDVVDYTLSQFEEQLDNLLERVKELERKTEE